MPTYELSDEGKHKIKNNFYLILLFLLPVLVISILSVVFIFIFSISHTDFFLLSAFIIIVTVSAVWMFAHSSLKSEYSVKIKFDNDELVQYKIKKTQIIIKKDEIRKVVRIKDQGLRVDSIVPFISIFISNDLVDYKDLETKLSSLVIIEDQDKKEIFKLLSGVFATLTIIIAAIIFKNKILWDTVDLIISVFLITSVIQQLRAEKSKKRLAAVVIIVACLIVFIIAKILR